MRNFFNSLYDGKDQMLSTGKPVDDPVERRHQERLNALDALNTSLEQIKDEIRCLGDAVWHKK